MREHGAALLVLVVVITVVLAALGLGVLALGQMEGRASRDGLHARQAAFAAESGLRVVKHWFDAPAGCAATWWIPNAEHVDRSQRRVDPDGDGTSEPYATAAPPWNVVYRHGRDDLFERPYRGGPELALEGDDRGPDILVSRDAQDEEISSFLRALSQALFPTGPAPRLSLQLDRIAVFAPPALPGGPSRRRIGIASVEVRAVVIRNDPEGETILARARAWGVLQEIPYATHGPLSAASVEDGSGLDVRWGKAVVLGDAWLGSDPAEIYGGGWPWRGTGRRLVADLEPDGTDDDGDADGTVDLHEWLALPDATLSDPWFQLLVGGAIAGVPSGGVQPYPFDPAAIPGAFATDLDRSGICQGFAGAAAVAGPLADLAPFRAAAVDGGPGAHLLRYVPGTNPPRFQELGGPEVTFEQATAGLAGLFYFDTVDGLPPSDADGDGSADNLVPFLEVTNAEWWAAGAIVVNAESLSLGPSSRALQSSIAPPGEPWDDADANRRWEGVESCLRLVYPSDPLASGASFTRSGIVQAGSGSACAPEGPRVTAPISFAGLLVTSGSLSGASSARIFGALRAGGTVAIPPSSGTRSFQLLYDARIGNDAWPPPELPIPRTYWQGRGVAP